MSVSLGFLYAMLNERSLVESDARPWIGIDAMSVLCLEKLLPQVMYGYVTEYARLIENLARADLYIKYSDRAGAIRSIDYLLWWTEREKN